MYDDIDVSLLVSEWASRSSDGRPCCPSCRSLEDSGKHHDGCAHDRALGSRAFGTQAERDHARSRIKVGSAPTLPPPPQMF